MNVSVRRNTPFWRAREARVVRPELWALAIVIVGMLLVEVWQSARMAELFLALDTSRSALTQQRSRLAYDRAHAERAWSRSELGPVAKRLGLAPMDVAQQIDLPSGYLARGTAPRTGPSTPTLAWLDRVSRALVPEATARSR